MKKLFTLLCLFFLFSLNLYPNSYKPGYIIDEKGDTINGFLLAQNSLNASRKCVFKTNSDEEVRTYSPQEIIAYRFAGSKYYMSVQIPAVSEKDQNRVFMEYLIKGVVSILYFEDVQGGHYYIEKEPYGIRELSDNHKNTDGSSGSANLYKSKLTALMADYPEILGEINTTKLNFTSLIELVRKYNLKMCSEDTCMSFERSPNQIKTNLGLTIAYTTNQYKFGNEFISNYGSGYQIGASLIIQNAFFSHERIEFSFDLLAGYQPKYNLKAINSQELISYKGVIYNVNNFGATPDPFHTSISDLDADFNLLDLRFPVMVNYKNNFGNLFFHAGFGLANKFVLLSNKDLKELNFENQYGSTFKTYYMGGISKIGLGMNSLKEHPISCNLVYEYYFDPTAVNSLLRLTENAFSVQFSYQF